MKKQLDEISIDELLDITPSFAMYLIDRHYKRNSVRTYCNYARRLLKEAEDRGWCPDPDSDSELWRPITEALRDIPRATTSIVRFAIRNGRTPSEFSDVDLDNWSQWMYRRGRKHSTVSQVKGRFRKAVIRVGIEHLLPRFVAAPFPTKYQTAIANMPEPLRTEVVDLLKWKQVKYAKGRPTRGRLRATSAKILEAWLCRLCGFAIHIKHADVHSLLDIVNEDIVTSFAEWAINERRLLSASVSKLSMIYSAVRHHPRYKNRDWSWFYQLFVELPEDDESSKLERKAIKYLHHDQLARIPEAIRSERLKLPTDSSESAWLLHDELLTRWLLLLPWRQRNLRECRIGDPSTANLFCTELPTITHIARAKWVEGTIASDPKARFWTFHFRPDETKIGGRSVRGIVPRALIGLLEEYLRHYRGKLIANENVNTLFVNRAGRPLDRQETTTLVSELALKYAGRRTTPHLWRDAYAYWWLEKFPEDYLTVSKSLWHTDLKYTLKVYARNFDESNAVRRLDDMLNATS